MANDKIPNLGFHHIALKVKNFDEALKFYTEGLGYKVFTGWGEAGHEIVMLDLGDGGLLELFRGESDTVFNDTGYIHFAVKVDDVDAAYNKAIAAGAKPHTLPKVVHLNSKPIDMSINIAFVLGPGGEQIEFFKVVEE